MKKILITILALSLALLPALALADSTMRVQGNATISVAPDIATVYAGFSGEDADSSAIQQQAADAITAIVEAVKALGIEDDDIVTSYLNTYPVYNYQDDGQQALRGYRVEHMIAITVNNLDIVGDVLDAALKAGANQSNGVTYKSSQEKDVYLKALALAIEDAEAKADALAIASGVWLGSLEQINEMTGQGTMRYANEAKYDMAMSGASIGSTLMTGELDVAASVELIYEIR